MKSSQIEKNMWRRSLSLVLFLCYISPSSASDTAADPLNCNAEFINFPATACYHMTCTDAIQVHVKEELRAAMAYLTMASQYDRSDVARPGLAKFFYECASEERGHAILMLDYLNMRGVQFKKQFGHVKPIKIHKIKEKIVSKDGKPEMIEGLKMAARMEIHITDAIVKLTETCNDDFHAADFLTSQILDEQHESLRKIQGAIKELENMGEPITAFAEYLLDRKILEHGL